MRGNDFSIMKPAMGYGTVWKWGSYFIHRQIMADAILPAFCVVPAFVRVFGEPFVDLLKGQLVAVGLFQGPVDEFRVWKICVVISLVVISKAISGRVAVRQRVGARVTHAVNGY